MNSLPSKRDEIVPEVTEKVRISGIKLSSELVLLYVPDPDNSGFSISPLFHILNEKRINMPFVAVSSMDTGFSGSCCVSSQDIDHVRNIVDADDILKTKVQCIHGVGMVSVFPHRRSMKVLGLSLHAFAKEHIPLLGMASSISALTFITDYIRLDEAAVSLAGYLNLPMNYTLLRDDLYSKKQED